MMNNTPSGAKMHHKSTKPESPDGQNVFSSSDELVKICDRFMMVCKQNSFFTEQCTSPSFFSRFEVTWSDWNRSLKNYGFLYNAIFSSRTLGTNHLTKCSSTLQIFNVGRYV